MWSIKKNRTHYIVIMFERRADLAYLISSILIFGLPELSQAYRSVACVLGGNGVFGICCRGGGGRIRHILCCIRHKFCRPIYIRVHITVD